MLGVGLGMTSVAVRRAGAAFSPASLPGAAVWLSAETGITLVTDRISEWASQVPGDHDFVQATAAQRPFVAADALNGFDLPDFQAGQQLRLNKNAGQIWVPDTAQDYRIAVLFATDADNALQDIVGLHRTGTNDFVALLRVNSTDVLNFVYRTSGSSVTSVTVLTGVEPGTYYWVEIEKDGAAITVRLNGVVTNTIVNSNVNVYETGEGGVAASLGGRANDTNFLNGRVAEFWAGTSPLTDGQRAAHQAWIESRYGLSLE